MKTIQRDAQSKSLRDLSVGDTFKFEKKNHLMIKGFAMGFSKGKKARIFGYMDLETGEFFTGDDAIMDNSPVIVCESIAEYQEC